MNRIEIPKGNGKTRVIWVPTAWEKAVSRIIQAELEERYAPHACVHGFVKGRSPVSNAAAHIGDWRFTLSMDIEAFFDNVRVDTAGKHLDISVQEIAERSVRIFRRSFSAPEENFEFPGGRAVQGLPCSPIIANLAMDEADTRILNLRNRSRFGWDFTYTRYADDLTFSYNHPNVGNRLLENVQRIIAEYGFRINPNKTHIQTADVSRRHITGIAVGKDGIYIPRALKRRLRAASHQAKNGMKPKTFARFEGNPYAQLDHLRGLKEWANLKEPKIESINLIPDPRIRSFTQPSNTPRSRPAMPVFNRVISA